MLFQLCILPLQTLNSVFAAASAFRRPGRPYTEAFFDSSNVFMAGRLADFWSLDV